MENLLDSLAAYLSGSSEETLNKKLSKLIRLRPKDLTDVDVVLPTIEVWKKCIEGEKLSTSTFEGRQACNFHAKITSTKLT